MNITAHRHLPITEESATIDQAVELISNCFQNGHRLYVCGNGGSASDAEHIVGELTKQFRLPRHISASAAAKLSSFGLFGKQLSKNLVPAFPVFSLNSQLAAITAVSNDVGFDYVFAQQVMAYCQPGDILWAISTSGCSKNVVAAALTAKALGAKIICMTGKNGGDIRRFADVCIMADSQEVCRIQEIHVCIYHTICSQLEEVFFGEWK